MKERITFIHPQGAGVDPVTFELEDAGLVGPRFVTTREDRLTLTLEELPSNIAIASVLQSNNVDVHVRWASPHKHTTLDPYSSRVSPGFHLSLGKRPEGGLPDAASLCSVLDAFGTLSCHSAEAFTQPQENTGATAFFYYQALESLDGLIKTTTAQLCTESDPLCSARLRSLYTAAGLDMSYDAASKTLKLTALWPLKEQTLTVPASPDRRTEVGILGGHVPPKMGPDDVGMSGALVVLGESKKPSQTMFAFPSRHRLSDTSFSASFGLPTGLHPTLQLRVSQAQPRTQMEESVCKAYAYLTLPKTVFADRYQFDDELFLASKNLTASRYTSLPVDLEAPAYTTKVWGSNVLVELAPPTSSDTDSWSAEVPLHLRYLEPSGTGNTKIEVPVPAIFWACEGSEAVATGKNPFDRRHLGYDGLFPPWTTFWHASPVPESGSRLLMGIDVPVLKTGADRAIELGTTAAVGMGFGWVLWKLISSFSTYGYGRGSQQEATAKKEQ